MRPRRVPHQEIFKGYNDNNHSDNTFDQGVCPVAVQISLEALEAIGKATDNLHLGI